MHETGHFSTMSAVSLFEQHWLPEAPIRAHVVLLHGFGDYSGRYAYVAERLNAAGLAVHAYDQRGHGRSPGRRAYITHFEVLLDDLDDFLEHVRPSFGDTPWFFMGHSMGGMVLARYAETRTCHARGMIFRSRFLPFNPQRYSWCSSGVASVDVNHTAPAPSSSPATSSTSHSPLVTCRICLPSAL